jgi:hypothetical protein
MAPLSNSLTKSTEYSKGGLSSARTHLSSGKCHESRSPVSKSKAITQVFNLGNTSRISHSYGLQQPSALLTGYSSSEEKDSKNQSSSQEQRAKRQQPRVKNQPRKRILTAKFKSAEFVESGSNSDEAICEDIAGGSHARQDTDLRSANQCPSYTVLNEKTSHLHALRDSKEGPNHNSSAPTKLRRRVGGSLKRSRLTVMTNKPSRTAVKKRVLSPPVSRTHTKRPKLRGGFVDDGSDSDSDLDSSGSEESGTSDNRGEGKPGSDLEITVNCKTRPKSPPPQQLPLGVRRPVPNSASQPPRPVNIGRLRDFIRKKHEVKLAKPTAPSNTAKDQAITAMVSCTSPNQTKLDSAQDSSSKTSHVLKTGTLAEQQCARRNSALGGSTLQSSINTVPSRTQGDSTKVKEKLSRPPISKSDLNTLNTVKVVQSVSRSTRHENQSAGTPSSALPLTRKPFGTTNRLGTGALSNTVASEHGAQGTLPAVRSQSSCDVTGNTRGVGDLIQGIRQSGGLQNTATALKSPSTLAQAREPRSDGQKQDPPQNINTPQRQSSQKKPSRVAPESSRKQIPLVQQNSAAPTNGISDTLKSKSKLATTQNPSQQPASRTQSSHGQVRTTTSKLQGTNTVPTVQKRKAEDMMSGSAMDAPLNKKQKTPANSNTITQSNTKALDKQKLRESSSSNRSTTSSTPYVPEDKATAKASTLTSKPRPQIPTPSTTVQEAMSTLSATVDQRSKLQRQTPQDAPKEILPDITSAQLKEMSDDNRSQSAGPDTTTMRKSSVSVSIPGKKSSNAIQGPKDSMKVSQVKDTVPQQVSAQMHNAQENPAKDPIGVVSSTESNSRPDTPAELPKATSKLPEKPHPTSQLTMKASDPAMNSPALAVSLTQARIVTSRPESHPGTILSTTPALAPDAEPYFEYSLFQKIWSDTEEESLITARELTSGPCTNIDEANTHAERLFNDALRQYQQHFQVQFDKWTNQPDEHGCNVFTGTFAPNDYPSKKSRMKF